MRRRHVPYVVTLHDGWWISPHQFIVARDGRPETYDLPTRGPAALLPERARITQNVRSKGGRGCLPCPRPLPRSTARRGLETVEVVSRAAMSTLARAQAAIPAPEGRCAWPHRRNVAATKGYVADCVAASMRGAIETSNLGPCGIMRGEWERARTPGGGVETAPTVLVPARTPTVRWGHRFMVRIDVLLAPSVWPESLWPGDARGAWRWATLVGGDIGSWRRRAGMSIEGEETALSRQCPDHHALVRCSWAGSTPTPSRYTGATGAQADPAPRRPREPAQHCNEVYQRILAPSGQDPAKGACPA